MLCTPPPPTFHDGWHNVQFCTRLQISIMSDLRFSRRWLWRIPSSGMWCRVVHGRTDVSEEPSVSIIKSKRISESCTALAVTSNRGKLRRNNKKKNSVALSPRGNYTDRARRHTNCMEKETIEWDIRDYLADYFNPDDGGDTFLRNFGSYKKHTVSHPRRRHCSQSPPWKPQILHSINRLGSVAET
jgi:hypothetical protein